MQLDANQLVGGLWCSDVLGLLSEYLDGQIAPEMKEQVDAHLGQCANCAHFGAEIAGLLDALSAYRR